MVLALSVCALAGVGVASSVASADNGATHLVGSDACGVLDSAPNCVATTFRAVSNHGGVEISKYSASGVFNDTGKAVHWDFTNAFGGGVAYCQSSITGALTTDWSETLSASGNATLTCKFHS